jgi:hypothetical protein
LSTQKYQKGADAHPIRSTRWEATVEPEWGSTVAKMVEHDGVMPEWRKEHFANKLRIINGQVRLCIVYFLLVIRSITPPPSCLPFLLAISLFFFSFFLGLFNFLLERCLAIRRNNGGVHLTHTDFVLPMYQ